MPSDHAMPIAETVEYVPQHPARENAAEEMAEALHAAPAPATVESSAESVPVAERGDHAAAFEPPAKASPAEEASKMPDDAAEARPSSSATAPAHEVTGPPSNPKRGWWRRVIDS